MAHSMQDLVVEICSGMVEVVEGKRSSSWRTVHLVISTACKGRIRDGLT